MITEKELKVLFSDENILKVMDEVLDIQYKSKPRYTLLKGMTRTTILEFGIRPQITETDKFAIVEIYYNVPWRTSKEWRLQDKIKISKTSNKVYISGFNTHEVSLQEAASRMLYYIASSSYLVNDATAIPIYF